MIIELLVSGIYLPYHLFIIGDSSEYTNPNINNFIYVNLELPKDTGLQYQAINTLKNKFESIGYSVVRV